MGLFIWLCTFLSKAACFWCISPCTLAFRSSEEVPSPRVSWICRSLNSLGFALPACARHWRRRERILLKLRTSRGSTICSVMPTAGFISTYEPIISLSSPKQSVRSSTA